MNKNILHTWWPIPLVLFLMFPSALMGQGFADTSKKIDLLFARLNENTPGAALRISRGNEVLYSKGFGMSDLEHSSPVSEKTLFEAGSVSKQFTATAILLLVRQGKINLDDPVNKYIPEFPKYQDTVRLRHLLNHTSGVRDWGALAGLGGWPRGTRVYNNQMALDYILRQEGLNNVPADEYLYSNSNYTLLTIIVERVSGKSLPEFTREMFFIPLGMKNTRWRNNFRAVVSDRAIGYDKMNGAFFSNMPFENTYGHAALLTNAHDLDIWNKSWKNFPQGGEDLLKMRTQQGILNNGEKIAYSAGVMISTHAGHPVVSHSGATAGYRCWLAYYPKDDLSVVYLSNATYLSTTGTGAAIADIFLGPDPGKQPSVLNAEANSETYVPDITKQDQWAGKYYSRECDGAYIIRKEKDSLYIFDHFGKRKALIPTGENNFRTDKFTHYRFKSYGADKQMFISVPRARNVKFESN